jgi:glucan 1,3-beta-glucosidase
MWVIPVIPAFLPSIAIDNLNLINAGFLVFVTNGVEYLSGAAGPVTITSWAMGPRYISSDGSYTSSSGFVSSSTVKSRALLDGNGKFFERSKPQYETLSASSFIVATDHGISNDATGGQSGAINTLLASNTGTPIFFPAGAYLVENTVFIPTCSILVGEGTFAELLKLR